jgi:malate dehydrogenase
MPGTVGIHGAAGAVGSAAAFALVLGGARRLVLADAAAAPLACQRIDLEALAAACHGLDVTVGELDALAACDVVVACGSAPHRDGTPRMAFLEANAAILTPLADALDAAERCPDVLVVSNPVDPLATWLQRRLGARARVLGHTLNDTLRLRTAIARVRGCAAGDVEAWSAGEHGPGAVALLSHAAVRGRRVTLSPAERAQVLDEVGGWYDRWQRLGTGRTTAWSSAWGVATIVRALLHGDPRVWPVSTLLRGEYGVEGVCLSVPVLLGPGRATRVLDWALADDEREALAAAAAAVVAGCRRLTLTESTAIGGIA